MTRLSASSKETRKGEITHLKKKFIYLASSGLSCSIWHLLCILWDLSLWCTGLVTQWHVGSLFPDQALNLCPLHCKALLTTGPPGKSRNHPFLNLDNSFNFFLKNFKRASQGQIQPGDCQFITFVLDHFLRPLFLSAVLFSLF